MTKEEKIQYEKMYEEAIKLLNEIMEMQQTIARSQINILTKLRRVHSLGFVRISDDLAVKHIIKFEPGKCSRCGVLIEGVYEYLRSKNKELCIPCYDSKEEKDKRKEELNSWKTTEKGGA